jgi:hypothetical protein
VQTRNHITAVILGTVSIVVPLSVASIYTGMSQGHKELMWGIVANLFSLLYYASALR